MIFPTPTPILPATPLRYEQCANGKFAICPRCGRTMANNFEFWACLVGCGLKLRKAVVVSHD